MDRVFSILILGLAAAYPLRALMLLERDGHEGPLRRWPGQFIYFPSTGHIQNVSLFDWVRRLFRVYKVDDILGQWSVREGKEAAERFTCPFCLSWWTTLPFSIGLAIYTKDLLWLIPSHLAIAIISQIVYRWLFDYE